MLVSTLATSTDLAATRVEVNTRAIMVTTVNTWINETSVLNVWVQRKGLPNVEIIKNLQVRDVAMFGKSGGHSILEDSVGLKLVIPITADGGFLDLEDGEDLYVKLSDATAGAKSINALEGLFPSRTALIYDEKKVVQNETIGKFKFQRGENMWLCNAVANLTEIKIRTVDGFEPKLTVEEAKAEMESMLGVKEIVDAAGVIDFNDWVEECLLLSVYNQSAAGTIQLAGVDVITDGAATYSFFTTRPEYI